MTSRHKILEFIYSNHRRLEADWQKDLEDLNIYDDIEHIYKAKGIDGDARIGNIVLAFTILAYDNSSRFLEPHKNRRENKEKILVTLAGVGALAIKLYQDIIDNKHEGAFNLAEWYVKYQKDWRWTDAIAAIEYHSMGTNMSNKGAIDADEAYKLGKVLDSATQQRRKADLLIDELRTEFLNLDTVLEKEGRAKVTDLAAVNFMSYEVYLGGIKNRT